ncbi:MAG TPA: RDD family protein [Patescibacteria group bacterium]|nr:RDD family protein [Patescibacteria group bacterium]
MSIEPPRYAPLWRRLLAAFYDVLPLAGLLMIATALALLLTYLLVPVERVDRVLRNGWPHVALQLWLGALTVTYFVISWRRGGQTIGMRAWKIAVRGETGALSLRAALLRVAVGAFLPGLLWCLFDPRRRALHDRVAGTVVLHLPKP